MKTAQILFLAICQPGIKVELFPKFGRTVTNLLKIVKESPYNYKGNKIGLLLCHSHIKLKLWLRLR